jgi:DNA-binding YbaB/EbfC family protein
MSTRAWYNIASDDRGRRREMFGSVKQIQQMQKKLAQAQEDLATATVSATAGGGVITVVITGNQEVKSIKIDPEAVDPSDVSMLEDLIVAAVNEALTKSQEMAAKRMAEVTGNLRLPGM